MHESWGFRATRAATFAAVCVLLAALGHVLMSGASLPGWAIPMAFAWIATIGWILADRERGVAFVVAGTLAMQAALHTVFTLAQTMAPAHQDAMHDHHLTGTSSFGMLGAHLVAALLCGLWLAYGERAAFSVLRSLAVRVLRRLRPVLRTPAIPLRPRNIPVYSPAPVRELLLAHAITSRGPPSGLAVR
ncbi:hypothetical protein [Kribbella sp. NPDC048928]|uniref:hypothetical protein n=1 Tax=Kribbella sp. NPDC048928 TaxID=3364111 RepID=UPI0037177044